MSNTLCERCGCYTLYRKMSFFNEEMICASCQSEEEAHPQYKAAREAESDACIRKDYNFPGIGLPEELKRKK